ncbi:cellulase family glycosylhydrolase [Sinomicrobium sp. M5D2P9]
MSPILPFRMYRQVLKLLFSVLCLFWSIPLIHAQSCWLEVNGKQIVNATTGQNVVLRSVGLGNWALQEGYMLHPQNCQGCPPGPQWQMKKIYYDEGQTPEQVENFYQQWRNNFITKADIDYIASLGFNSVRLPMHYELFLSSAQRTIRNNVINDINYGHDIYKDSLRLWYDNNQLFNDPELEGFRMIDNLLSWCKDNGMYVILDLHAAPGGQGADKNIADIFHDNNLWLYPVFQDVTDRLWDRISQRYINEPGIAFYDLINEPNQVPGGGQVIHALLQRLITTVRNNGDNHMIMVEGNGWGNNYDYMEPSTFSPNWGLVYNAHRYWIDEADDWVADPNPNQINRMANLVNFRDTHNVPVWVGETGENNNQWLRQNIEKLDTEGIGWCHWTYKRFDVAENAALMRIGGNYPTDGASVMAGVLESIKFENCIPNTNTIATVTQDLPAPGTSICGPGNSPEEPPVGQTIWLRGNNGKYVSSEDGQSGMTCNRDSAGDWEVFTVVGTADGKVALRGSNNQYVSSENGESPLLCNRTSIGGWEAFEWLPQPDATIALRGGNGMYVSSENGENPMLCDRPSVGDWEKFEFGLVSSGTEGMGIRIEANPENTREFLLKVYPNPVADGNLFIGMGKENKDITASLFTIEGQQVMTRKLHGDTSDMKLQLPGTVRKGVYILKLNTADGNFSKKIMVQ